MDTTTPLSLTSDLPSSSASPTTPAPKKKSTPPKKTSSKTPRSTTANLKGERMTFELDDVLRKYSPDQFKTCKAYDVGGVNILNKKPLDSKTALDKIKRRRETHNRVERRRRDCINQLIDELTTLLPRDDDDSASNSHRVNVLRTAVAHIQNLTRHNETLHQQLKAIHQNGPSMPPPAIVTTLAPKTEEDDGRGSFVSEPSPSISPLVGAYSPASPRMMGSPGAPPPPTPQPHPIWQGGHHHHQHSHSLTHLAPIQLPGPATSSPSSRSPSPLPSPALLPSLGELSAQLPAIPMIIEPSSSDVSNGGSHAKRLQRQTLPRLQLAPPPFQHGRPSISNSSGAPSPSSSYSGYSSSSGPWSASTGTGPLSPNSMAPFTSFASASPRSPGYSSYGPPSPYSLYGPPSAQSPSSSSSLRSPGQSPWTPGGPNELYASPPGQASSDYSPACPSSLPQYFQPQQSGIFGGPGHGAGAGGSGYYGSEQLSPEFSPAK